MVFTLLGMSTFSRLVHPSKALPSIVVTPLGMVTLFNSVQPLKALLDTSVA